MGIPVSLRGRVLYSQYFMEEQKFVGPAEYVATKAKSLGYEAAGIRVFNLKSKKVLLRRLRAKQIIINNHLCQLLSVQTAREIGKTGTYRCAVSISGPSLETTHFVIILLRVPGYPEIDFIVPSWAVKGHFFQSKPRSHAQITFSPDGKRRKHKNTFNLWAYEGKWKFLA